MNNERLTVIMEALTMDTRCEHDRPLLMVLLGYLGCFKVEKRGGSRICSELNLSPNALQ